MVVRVLLGLEYQVGGELERKEWGHYPHSLAGIINRLGTPRSLCLSAGGAEGVETMVVDPPAAPEVPEPLSMTVVSHWNTAGHD